MLHTKPVLSVGALALSLLLAAAVPAAAQSEPTTLQKVLGGLGLLELPPENPPDYRERAPLVVPPSTALVAPRNPEDVARHNADWPLDHDSRLRSEVDPEEERKADENFYGGRPLRPSELSRGTISRQEASRRDAAARGPGRETAGEEYTRGGEVYSPSQLGFKGWNAKEEKAVVFTGEPARRSLTDPPPGLLTPSREAPYGVVTTKSGPPAPTTLHERVEAQGSGN